MTIQKSDPDVIVGHEFLGVSLDILLGRIKDLKADHWSRIGRFRRPKLFLGKPGTNLKLLCGRLVCDLASDGAKVRGSTSFFGRRQCASRSEDLWTPTGWSRLRSMLEKHVDHCASNALHVHDHCFVRHVPTLTDAADTDERTR